VESPARYLRPAVANGVPEEQALIRRWWYESHAAQGRVVWEYALENRYIDCVWLPDEDCSETEESGNAPKSQRSISGTEIVICEAKMQLNPELIGQAIVYRELALRAGAAVRQTLVFAERGDPVMQEIAEQLGLVPVIRPLDAE
jgi:hypothetical protein